MFVDGNDAIVFYKKIIDLCETNLNSRGKLYFELNPLTANEVKAYAESKKLFTDIDLKKDISGNIRFLKAIKNVKLNYSLLVEENSLLAKTNNSYRSITSAPQNP